DASNRVTCHAKPLGMVAPGPPRNGRESVLACGASIRRVLEAERVGLDEPTIGTEHRIRIRDTVERRLGILAVVEPSPNGVERRALGGDPPRVADECTQPSRGLQLPVARSRGGGDAFVDERSPTSLHPAP